MLYYRHNHIEKMKQLVANEIANTQIMQKLCENDCRLGYHSEAEGYLFFPAKLAARIELLQNLLEDDFTHFNLNAKWIDEYTGRTPKGMIARCTRIGTSETLNTLNPQSMWSAQYDEDNLYVFLYNVDTILTTIVLEPCRLWSPLRLDFYCNELHINSQCFSTIPKYSWEKSENRIKITLSRSIFNGFARDSFPMRINIYGKGFSWISPQPWPNRLLHGDFNPAAAGWLVFE